VHVSNRQESVPMAAPCLGYTDPIWHHKRCRSVHVDARRWSERTGGDLSEVIALPNTGESLRPLVASGRIPMKRVWFMLALRSALSFALLIATAAVLRGAGRENAVSSAAAWWLWFVTVANIACILLMVRFGRAEGLRLRDLYFASKSTWRGDVTWALIALVGIGILAILPGMWLAQALWGDPNLPNGMLIQALPALAVYPLIVLTPLSQAFAELPTYWGYVAPRLRAFGMTRWLVIGLVGAVLSVQHLFFAFQLDWRYDLWLALKYLPFALWTGYIIDRRPTTLPYLMGVHFALDASIPVLVLLVTNGMSITG